MRTRTIWISLALSLLGPKAASQHCFFQEVASDTPLPMFSDGAAFYQQFSPQWMAVGVRPLPNEDWNVAVYTASSVFAPCVDGTSFVAQSTRTSGVDFVVGDYHFGSLPETDYPYLTRPLGISSGQLEYQQSTTISLGSTGGSFTASEVLDVYEVHLQAYLVYTFDFLRSINMDAKLCLLRNPGSSRYFTGRDAREFEMSIGAATYVAPATGDYVIVVVNENATAGSYTISISQTCDLPLAAGVSTSTNEALHSVDAVQAQWTAFALRSSGADNWNLSVLADGRPATCAGAVLGTSSVTSGVDVVACDGGNGPGRVYTSALRNGATANATVQWDGRNTIGVGAGTVNESLSAAEVLRVWDVTLDGNTQYTFNLTVPQGNLKLLLFRTPAGGGPWFDRSAAEFATSTNQVYTAPAGGRYGLVLVNDGGTAAQYSLSVDPGCVPPTVLPMDTAVPPASRIFSTDYRVNQVQPRWAGASEVPEQGFDFGYFITAYSGIGAWPNCLTGPLATSAIGPGARFVVGDFHHTPTGTYYVRVSTSGGVEWDDGGSIPVNGPEITVVMDGLIDVYDVALQAGVGYRFRFVNVSGFSDSLVLFRNPTAGPYWAAKSQQVFQWTPGAAGNLYVAPATETYGLVVYRKCCWTVGGSSTYRLSVDDCTSLASIPDLPLGNSQVQQTTRADYALPADGAAWTAVSVAPVPQSSPPWTVTLHPAPACNPVALVSDNGPDLVDFVVSDNRTTPRGPLNVTYTTPSTGNADFGHLVPEREIYVNDVAPTTGTSAPLRLYTIGLEAGLDYDFSITPANANMKILLFRGNSGWQTRSARVFETNGTQRYTAITTEQYLLAVVGDDLNGANYSVAVTHPGPCGDGNGRGSIGLFFDAAGTQRCAALPAGVQRLYVIAELAGASSTGIKGAEFRLEASGPQGTSSYFILSIIPGPSVISMQGTLIDDTPGVHGPTPEGVIVELGTCQGSQVGDKVLLATVDLFVLFATPIEVRTMPRYPVSVPSYCESPQFVLCDPGATHVCLTTDGRSLVREPVLSRTYINTPTCTGCGASFPTDSGEPEPPRPPLRLALANAPDPFNPSTTIRYSLPKDGRVTLSVYDAGGRLVRDLVVRNETAGEHTVIWDGRNGAGRRMPSGVYFAAIQTPSGATRDRMTIVK